MLLAIDFMHSHGFMHRDLKPENILITEDNQLKICDFGLARAYSLPILNELTHEVMTLWYRAPEVLMNMKTYPPAVDIWSAGHIIVSMINGAPIWNGNSEVDLIFQIFKYKFFSYFIVVHWEHPMRLHGLE
jgi:serine/threonine protein kinase